MLILPLVSLLVSLPPAAAQVPSFPASVESVYLDVFVARDGRPVMGLKAADFEVLDNGVRQAVTLVGLERVPLVAIMVFDASGSVIGAKRDDLKAAGRTFLAGLRDQDQATLVAFSHELRVAVPHASDRAAVRRALDGLGAGGGTALWDALYAGLTLPASGRPMVVVFTDGEDNMSWLSAERVRAVAEESEALVHVVAIVPPPEEAFTLDGRARRAGEPAFLRSLRGIAEVTGGRLWPVGASAELERTFVRILAEMQSRYLLSYEPAGVEREGRHRLQVRVKGHRGSVRSRRGYLVQARAR
jgi:VWFA-related protein